MKKLAILDDYQNVAMDMADWSPLEGDVEITVFNDHLSDEDDVAARLAEFEIVMLMRERTPFPRSLIEKLPKLEHIVSSGMRNLSIDIDAATDNGVICTGTPSLGYPTAELTWGMIHALARNVALEDRETRAGAWQKTVGIGLRDKVLGIMGLGRIGTDIARVGIATGMQVIAWSENLTQDRCDEVGARLVSKDELLEQSDFLTIHLLLSDRTRGLLQADDLARMKSSAYLINTSPGTDRRRSGADRCSPERAHRRRRTGRVRRRTVAGRSSAAEHAQYGHHPAPGIRDGRELPQLVWRHG